MMNDVEKPTVIYFNTLARGEVPRLIFELKGIDYAFRPISHPIMKNQGEPWDEYKAKHADELLFGQLPQYKEPGGVNIVQSASIIRYLAKKHDFNGANEQEALEIDILTEGVSDLTMAFIRAKWYNPDESKREEDLKKFLSEALPKHLAHFQRALERNHGGNGYFVGDKISYMDLSFVVVVKLILEHAGADKELVKLPASLAGLFTRVTELPAIKKYYDSNPYQKAQ